MTPAWMEGYTSDIEYTSGYYREQEPEQLNFSAVLHGVEPVSLEHGFTYCELGCGLGLTSLIMAANYPQGQFWAVDYNPAHIAQAQRMAKRAGLDNIHFLELSFEEIVQDKTRLPACDFITFHGIYAWITDVNRQHLVTICKQHLKAGGLVYNSYNALPGWAAVTPLQKALLELSQTYKGSSLERFKASRDFLTRFRELKPRYFELNDKVLKPRLNNIQQADPHYLVHEYLHDGWKAFHFSEVADHFSSAKLEYVGQANPAEAYANDVMPATLKQMLAEHEDSRVREMLKDLAYNTAFRKDVYVRGGRKLNMAQQLAWLREKQWLPLTDKDVTTFKFNLSVGEVTGKQETYQQALQAIQNGASTLSKLENLTRQPVKDLVQILVFLYSGNLIGIKHDLSSSRSAELNKSIAKTTGTSGNHFVAAANIGTAANLNPLDLNFLKLYITARQPPDQQGLFAQKLHAYFEAKGLNLTYQGDTYIGDAMQRKLLELEQEWRESTLPLWTKLGII